MARNLSTAILRFLARLARRQVTRALDDATLRDLADALAEIDQEELAARLGAFFASEDRRAALARALERADACARQRLASTPWHGPARQLPLRGLPSLLQALEALPDDDPDETRLRQALAQALQRDWRATPEQARGLADLYLTCLRAALLEVETDALRTLGRNVLRTEAAVQRLEQALQAWQEKARREVRLPIQGAVEKSAIVIGDYNIVIQTIVEPVRRLPVDYAPRIEEFLQAYLGTPENPVPFGGRDAALAELDAWLADAHTPYLLLTAPAGRGKSALLVRWLERARRQHPGMAVVFVPVSIRYSTNSASVTFAALAAQLARAFGDPVPADPHTPAEVWKAIAAQYLRREPPPEGLLVVLDGLDEAADWEPDPVLFPLNPRPGLKVAVSARLTATRPRAADWRRALGWERLPVQEMALEPLDRPGLQDVMLKMGAPTDELARKPFIVEELHRLTGGDPLLVRFYVEDLWKRRGDALRLTPEDLHRLQPGYEGYFQSWWEYQHQLWDEKAPLRERSVREVLNLLATALGPLPKDALLELAHPEAGLDTWTLEEALRPLARFVVQAPEGYIFGHPKLGDFFFGRLARREQAELEARFLRWGAEVLAALEQGRLAPREAPAYLVRYYRAHLARARAPLAAFRRLVATDAWARAWEALEGSYAGYLSDVRAVWERAGQENVQALEGPPDARADGGRLPAVGLEIRCALIEASIHSLAARLPAQLPALLVEDDLWTPAQALAHLRQMPDERKRAEALAALAPVLARKASEALAEALQAARSIASDRYRAKALAALAPHLPPELLPEALQAARSIEWPPARAEALAALAPHLPPELLPEALQAARELPEQALFGSPRVEALAALASHLPPDRRPQALEEALQAARSIEWPPARAEALAALAPHPPPEQRRQALHEALQAARSIENDHWRTEALAALAPHLPPELLAAALQAAQSIESDRYRAHALAALAPHLPPEQRRQALHEALQAARSIENDHWRTEALAALAPHLPEKQHGQALQEALQAARSIEDATWRAHVLAALAPHLPLDLLPQALQATRSIEDATWRAHALAALAPHLPQDLLPQALQAARSIEDARYRAEALAALALHLPPELLPEALQAARSIASDRYRAKALAALAPKLAEAELPDKALQAAQSIESDRYRAKALAALAPHLPPKQRRQTLHEALQAARSIENDHWRAEALAALTPHLPPEQRGQALREALQAARSIKDDFWRARALAALAPHLPPARRRQALREALQAARSIESDWRRAKALAALAPHLPPELLPQALQEALQAARSIEDDYDRSRALAALAPHLPPELLPEALQAARSIEDATWRAHALAALAPHLPPELLPQALQAARSIENDHWRAEALAALAPHLPPDLRPQVLAEALQAARSIERDFWRAHALAALAPHLPPELLPEALQAARSIEWPPARAHALAALAPHLPPELLAEALQAALELPNNIFIFIMMSDLKFVGTPRTEALAALAPHLPPEQRRQALHEALQAARSIASDRYRAHALAALAPHLPPEQRGQALREALQAARSIASDRYRARALAALAPHLPQDLLLQALQAARSIRDADDRAKALATLAPHLPEEQRGQVLHEALQAARSIRWADARARALAALAPRLAEMPRERLYPLWCETLPFLAGRTRKDLLADLRALAPVIQALGGAEALAETFRAIQDVGRWWE